MIPTSLVIKLIKSFKNGNQDVADKCIKEIIRIAENKNQPRLASELRLLYGVPTNLTSSESNIASSSLSYQKNNLYQSRDSKINLSNIALSKGTKDQVDEIVRNFEKRELILKKGFNVGNKVLLYGKPGTGKTMLAYAIAGQLNLPIIHVFLDELISSFLGETGKNIRQIFESNKGSDAIIFLDEFDTIAKKRDDSQELGELKRVVTVLLQNIDEMDDGNILIAATNHEHLLDEAIWRRFDYQLHIDLPDEISRSKIIKSILGRNGDKVDLKFVTKMTMGMSGADIKTTLSKSLRNQIVHGSSDIYADILKAISEVQDKNFIRSVIKDIKKREPKKYTYKKLEELTGIPHSTLYSWLKGN